MITFPNAKINLGLNVVAQRSDGFHDIETVIFPVALHDALEILPSGNGMTTFTFSGLSIPGVIEENLCFRALKVLQSALCHPTVLKKGGLLHEASPLIPALNIHLHKVIPLGSGLGGGSSDAAYMLKTLNELFELGLSPDQLANCTRQLGSDTTFFIENKPVFAFQKGDYFIPVSLSLSRYKIVLVVPYIHVSTQLAYSMVRPKKTGKSVREIILRPPEEWRDLLFNDFEEAVMGKHPKIRAIKDKLYSLGAVYASMSGSGSAVYGMFNELPDTLDFFKDCFTWTSVMG